MTSRERFLNAFTGQPPDRPPAWIMRQAGRYLPEYRELKTRHDFLTLVRTPELAAEVTLQPLQRFAELDAAIIFSDILILPEALGVGYAFREAGGIAMERTLSSQRDMASLDPEAVRERTAYLPQALRLVRQELGPAKALLGFAGSPWTLATYLVEGGSSRDFSRIQELFSKEPAVFEELMERLTRGLIHLLLSQIEAGVDAVQIFDSWAAAAPKDQYPEASLQWIQRIIEALPGEVPVILFAKGMSAHHRDLLATGAAALAIDHGADLPDLRRQLDDRVVLQGNLNPEWMTGPPEAAARATRELLDAMLPWNRYIFNLGHGITPQARIETVEAVLRCLGSASRQ